MNTKAHKNINTISKCFYPIVSLLFFLAGTPFSFADATYQQTLPALEMPFSVPDTTDSPSKKTNTNTNTNTDTNVLKKTQSPISTEKTWTLNQQNSDIREFITQVARITQKTFVIDPRIKGGSTVTVISSKSLTKDQVYDIFLEVLTTNGYTAIPKGKIIDIVPNTTAKTSGQQQNKPHSATMTTRVIELHSVSSVEMMPIIRPLVAQYGHAAASASSNAVIVCDLSDNVERIAQLIKTLDIASDNDYEVIPIKYAWVGDIVKIIQETLIIGKGHLPSSLQVIADERSNRLVIKGNASKRARVKKLVATLDQSGVRKSSTKVVFLSYGDAKNLAEILTEASATIKDTQDAKSQSATSQMPSPLSRFSINQHKGPAQHGTDKNKSSSDVFIKADETQNALIMIANPDTLETMERIVRQLDRPRAQVLLEAAIVEIVGDINDALGIQWGIDGRATIPARSGGDPKLSNITGYLFDNSKLGFGALALRNDNFGILVHALSKKTNSNILSTPSLLTLDNQEAHFLVGENIPIKTGSYQTASQGDTKNPFTTTERKDIGIKLKLTPHVGEGNSLRLELEQEVSSRRTSVSSTDNDIIYDNRTLKTTVLIDDGQTVVIGGLIRDDHQNNKHKVPVLGDIPILGNLFKYQSYESTKRNLMLFVRPTIMRNSETLIKASQDRFTKLKLIQQNGQPSAIDDLPKNLDHLFDSKTFGVKSANKPAWVPK
ncbi:MAG: type II secretion system secretin GspD [Endozoicomonas sp. (ex Botrylloides leachii)]|nr:type II secretion system secretin GspD [Endozoicomonas sp. (ex Botrylloides leachii)]